MANYTTLQLRFTEIILDGEIWYDSNLIKLNSGVLGLHLEMDDDDSHYMAIHHSLSGQKFTSKYHDYFGVLYDNLVPGITGIGQILKIRIDKLPTYAVVMGNVEDAGDIDPENPDDIPNAFATQDMEYFRSGNSEIFCFGT